MTTDFSSAEDDSAKQAQRDRLGHIRHELRTPINHIMGYSDLILEELDPAQHPSLKADLEKVQFGGRQLLHLIGEFFEAEKRESRRLEVSQIYHELRTPVNQIIGYSELLQEEAVEAGLTSLLPDLEKIHRAALHWLRVMESHLLADPAVPLEGAAHAAAATQLTRPHGKADSYSPAPGSHQIMTGSILVVDDDATNREMLSRRLHKRGFSVTIARDGAQALELVRQRAFDLILLDVVMPGLSGYEVLCQLKGNSASQHIPVLMLSALDDLEGIVRCIECGAEDYISKPFNAVFLQARIGAALEKKRMRDREKLYLEQIEQEKAKAERLLLNILPASIAARLKKGETTIADSFAEVSVLFADLVGFTALSARVEPGEMVRILNGIFSTFDSLAGKHGLEKIKTIGDAYMAVAGLPEPQSDHAEAAAEMALDMLNSLDLVNRVRGTTLQMRIGINSGVVVAGIVGTRKFAYDLWGDTVNMASRMESHGQPGHIHVTQATYERIRHRFQFESRGQVEIKGKGAMTTYWLAGRI
ncbi:MAG: response regulator [Verrucomicrobia bacterium]|nr:response regulator [Verrucomicrobiota bacterium]